LHEEGVAFHETLQHVLSSRNLPFELPSSLANVIEDQFYQRRKMLTINLHYVKALLNSYSLGEALLHDNVDVKETLNKILQKTASTPTTNVLVFKTS
jgi:hypothetical protein